MNRQELVFARSISPGRTVGRFKTPGGNMPVKIGPVEIHPGDIMVADGRPGGGAGAADRAGKIAQGRTGGVRPHPRCQR